METWREVIGWEGAYEVSDFGSVRSLTRTVIVLNPKGVLAPRTYIGRVLRPGTTSKGYKLVSFTSPGRKRRYAYVHDLVLSAFRGPKPEGLEACHFDGVPANNQLENLRYDTRSNNALDRNRHGTMNPPRGEAHPQAKLTDDRVREIRKTAGAVGYRELGRRFDVSKTTISGAHHGATWRHVR